MPNTLCVMPATVHPRREASGTLCACHTCGLIQLVPSLRRREVARCARCRSLVRGGPIPTAASRCAAMCVAAIACYLPAMTLPVIEVSKLNFTSTATIPSGIATLFADGEHIIAVVVLLASVVVPITKLIAMLSLCWPELWPDSSRGRNRQARTYKLVDWLGRWGMLDVLLVAVLVAVVKLGSWVEVEAGPGVLAFAGVVIFSLLASAAFDPRMIWADEPTVVGETDHSEDPAE